MGQAIGPAHGGAIGGFVHGASGTRVEVVARGGKMVQRLERKGIVAEQEVAYRIGSGSHAAGYLVRVGEWLFQSPMALYRDGKWAAAPGYEGMARIDFNRRVTQECLDCHSNGNAVDPQPIGCAQCHGYVKAHLAKPGRGNVLRPVGNEGCETCHLTGEARIGGRVVVYDRPRQDLRVVSHVEQLALSRCEKLECVSCHAVHGEKIDVNAKCQSCHEPHDGKAECVSCHMPKRAAVDGGHTAFTDHRIQKTALTGVAEGPVRLKVWRGEQDARVLGLAEIEVGERDGSEALIQSGYRRLAAGIAKWEKDAEVLAAMGMVLFLKDQKADGRKLLAAAVALKPGDAGLREKLGLLERATGDLAAAKGSFEKAIELDPAGERAYFLLAECQPSLALRGDVLRRLLRVLPQSLLAREALARP